MPLTNHIAIYGGSFDPPHIGHQIGCLWLLEALNALKVVVVPTYEHYFGKKLAPFKHRVEMCRIMTSSLSGCGNIEVSSDEEHLPKPNTTFNLVRCIISSNPGAPVAVIIGTDLIPNLHKWSKWDEVAKIADIVAIGRSGYDDLSSPYDIHCYPVELSAVSSSEIRNRIASGMDITGLVSKKNKQYILDNGLYR